MGILLMNIVGMGLPDPAYWDPSMIGGDTGANWIAWLINALFFEGTMRGIFSLLFGASMLIFVQGRHPAERAILWYRRSIVLILFGILHAYGLLWSGDILYTYGIIGLILFPLRPLQTRQLIGLALTAFSISTWLNLQESREASWLASRATLARSMIEAGETPPEHLRWSLEEWSLMRDSMKRAPESIEEEIRTVRQGYIEALKYRAPNTYWMQTHYFFRYAALDVFAMMVLGMALFKLGILQAHRPRSAYLLMLGLGYGVGALTNWYESMRYTMNDFDLVSYYQTNVTYELGRVFTTCGHLGALLWVFKTGNLRPLQNALAAVGRLALTNYISQTVITTTVFVGFKQFGAWERYQLYYLVAVIWIGQLTLSPLWLARFRYGPMEWLLRCFTYWKWQPFLRSNRRSQ